MHDTTRDFGFAFGWIQITFWAKAPLSTGFEYMHSNNSPQQNYTGNSITVKLNDHRNVRFNLNSNAIWKFARKIFLLKKIQPVISWKVFIKICRDVVLIWWDEMGGYGMGEWVGDFCRISKSRIQRKHIRADFLETQSMKCKLSIQLLRIYVSIF